MSISKRCSQQPCDASPAWRMVAPGGFVTGLLCAYHKEAWYDAREDHKTTLVTIDQKGRSHEVDTKHKADWEDMLSEPAESTPVGIRLESRGDNSSGVGAGTGDRHLTTISKYQLPAVDSPIRAGGNDLCSTELDTSQVRQYGTLALTEDEITVLRLPPDDDEVEIRADGIVYVPWNEVANRLDLAIGVGQWTLVPDGKPMIQDGYCCWQFHLFVRGHWVTTAIGEHPENKFSKMSLANRAESAKSDALVKCSKALGIFRELWSPGWRIAWQEKHCVRVWALQTERSTAGAWLWRRKDRNPFFKERPAKDTMETEYHKRRDYNEDARDHVDAIARGDA